MVETVGFGYFHSGENDEDGAVGAGVGEQLVFVFVELFFVEVAAQGVAYLCQLGGKEGVGVDGAAGVWDALA